MLSSHTVMAYDALKEKGYGDPARKSLVIILSDSV
jgi:hypothetical protein